MAKADLKSLPAVERVLQHAALADALAALPRAIVVAAVRAELGIARAALMRPKAGAAPDAAAIARAAAARAAREATPQLRRLLNATGIVLHTNLGRAPLAPAAKQAVADVASGYSSLEYDLDAGKRGDRGTGIERALTRLTGAEAACVVNNGAAAILLALSGIAAGKKVLVSRGELVEIGGSFRVPEIMEKSGAILVEVGATNRTHLRDYETALAKHGRDVAAILRVHPSNFRIAGFTARPELADLAKLAKRAKVALIEDLGSGALVDLAPFGLEHEPTVGESLAAGADVVTFSGDKLLGGAQAGMILGSAKLIARIKKDPFARAMRMDKLALAALEATLALYGDPAAALAGIPALGMLRASADDLKPLAENLAWLLAERVPGLSTRVVANDGEVGGGALPLQKLPGWAVACTHAKHSADALERAARAATPPVIGTVRAQAFRMDVRTLGAEGVAQAVEALTKAWGA
jgi:L-seryl-tRNA(Ser) seleniumtransferase